MQAPKPKPTRTFYTFGPYRLYANGELFQAGRPLLLPPKSSDVLLALVSRHGRLATKDELMREVWPNTFVEDETLMVAPVSIGQTLGIGAPQKLFSASRLHAISELELSAGYASYDVASDGKRFVVRQTVQRAKARIRLVQNWHRELQASQRRP